MYSLQGTAKKSTFSQNYSKKLLSWAKEQKPEKKGRDMKQNKYQHIISYWYNINHMKKIQNLEAIVTQKRFLQARLNLTFKEDM